MHRFGLEHTFRLFKQVLGWTAPKIRDPQAAPRPGAQTPTTRPTPRLWDCGSNGVSGPITLSLAAWRERCRDDRDTRGRDEEEGQAGADR